MTMNATCITSSLLQGGYRKSVLLLPPFTGEGWDGGSDASKSACAYLNAAGPHPNLPPLRRGGSGKGKRSAQSGVSMFIVLIIMLLALILVLGGLTVTGLNEALVGNQSDAQRAYGSAQALIDAAQRDIRLNGRNCSAAVLGGTGSNDTFQVGGSAADCTLRFPRDFPDYMDMVSGSAPGVGKCASGVCISQGPTDPMFAAGTTNNGDATTNAQQWDKGADYITYVKALDNNGAAGTAYGGGATTGNGATLAANGRYWVEVFPYFTNTMGMEGAGDAPIPKAAYPFVFRITAMSKGLKGGTVSVLRTYYTPYPGP